MSAPSGLRAPRPDLMCVVLAAGASKRFGRNKLLMPLQTGTLLERAFRACSNFPAIFVCSPQTQPAAGALGARTILNERPEGGMSYSLRLANEQIDPFVAIAVLPADLLLIEASHLRGIVSRHGKADVTFPLHPDGTPGHPVIFSARARTKIAGLSDGDTIRAVRDDPQLRRNAILTPEPWPFRDADDESDLSNL